MDLAIKKKEPQKAENWPPSSPGILFETLRLQSTITG